MDDLKNHFLERSVAGLRELEGRLRAGDGAVPADAFRTLHTIKGTAQTFGFAEAAGLAHQLEDLFVSGSRELLVEGIPLLIEALGEKNADRGDFSQRAAAAMGEKPTRRKTFISRIPLETFEQFSDLEKQRIVTIDGGGMDIFCLQVGFDLASFTEDFKAVREKIDAVGEIIATLPGAGGPGQISFRIYAAAAHFWEMEAIRAKYSGRLEPQSIRAQCHLYEAMAQIGEHAETLAANSGKDVNVVISLGDIPSDIDTIKTIFDVLVHLVRNAVDHAFVERGTISIGLKEITNGGLSIIVSDDGKGLDREKLKSKAIERGINLDTEDPLNVIFMPGFSTAETVSDISGRGVGLDAVKSLVENRGGTIAVESEKDKGTKFDIFIPHMRKPGT